ncbi:MAG: sphingomyelin phosphodiesterase [bacterium]
MSVEMKERRRTPFFIGLALAMLMTAPPGVAGEKQRWIGTAPFCGAEKSDCAKYGMEYVRSSKRGDGKKCVSGKKVLCRAVHSEPGQRWIGTAPICKARNSDCRNKLGMRYVTSAKCGDGKCCMSGKKVLCAPSGRETPGIWLGTAPACNADKSDCGLLGMRYVASYKKGSGKTCITGAKVLCRIPERPRVSVEKDDANLLSVLSYNIFGRPFTVTHDGQVERTCRIPYVLAGLQAEAKMRIDVIAFSEAFIDGCEKPLDFKRLLKYYGWPHVTDVVSGGGRPSNGGVFIASRWPIVKTAQHVFKACALNEDCLAAKGVQYARIRKSLGGTTAHYNIFATHLQARTKNKESGVKTRFSQAREFAVFVAGQEIDSKEPVIYAGDFNIDLNNAASKSELAAVREILNAGLPRKMGDMNGTYIGDLAEPKTTPKTWLDYVMYSKNHRLPGKAAMMALPLGPVPPFKVCMSAKVQPHHVRPRKPWCGDIRTIKSLSDHAPVLATFLFEE